MSWWQESTPVGDSSNLTKFLNFLSQAEGADYNTIVGGSKFDSFDAHPGVVGLRTKEGPSTAAGRYQITKTTYNDVAPRLGIKDFSPQSQDAIAIELIRRGGAYDDVVKGNFEAAINKLGGTWASLPSSPYSQPKKSWADVNKMLGVQVASNNASEKWWAGATPVSDAPSNDNWWAGATPVQQAEPAPQAAPARPQPAPAAAAPAATSQPPKAPTPAPTAAAAPQRSAASNFGLGTRNVLEGVEQAFTYPVRAVGEAASGIAGLLGRPDLADTISRTVGMKNRGAGALVADAAGLAKPETKTEKIVAEGTKAAAGLLSGSVVNKIAEKAPQAVQSTLGILMPGTSGSASNVAKDVGVFGGLGAAFEAAPAETAAGLAVLAGGKAAAGKVIGPKVSDALDNRAANRLLEASGPRNVRQDGEIIRRMSTEFNDPLRTFGGAQKTLTTKDLNGAIEKSFLRDAEDLVSQLPKTFEGKDVLTKAIGRGVTNSTEQIEALRKVQGGEQVADLIEAAKRTKVVTAAVASTGGVMPAVRYGVQKTLPGFLSEPINAVLGQRQTREAVGQKLIDKYARGVNKVEERFGAAPSKVAAQELSNLVSQAQTARQTQIEAARMASSQKKADKAAELVLKQQREAEAALEAARAKTVANANKAGLAANQQATQKLLAERAAQEAEQLALEAARKQTTMNAVQQGRTNAQNMAGNLVAERAAQAEELARLAQARQQTLSNANAAGVRNAQNASAALTAERQAAAKVSDKMASATSAEQAALEEARAATVRRANEASQRNLEAARKRLLSERASAEDKAALDAINRMNQGSAVTGGGSLRATVDRMARDYGLDEKGTRDLITKLRDTVDADGKAVLDKLLRGENVPGLFKLQDNVLAPFAEKSGIARLQQAPGALSAETGRVFNQTSYDATVRTAEAARDAAIKSAPSDSLKQFAIDIANEKNPALKVEKLQSRVKATTDPEELGYLLNMVDPLTKFGKKAKK